MNSDANTPAHLSIRKRSNVGSGTSSLCSLSF